jgi:hypothetical protein
LSGGALAVLASILGVTAAVLSGCGIGLMLGTDTLCSPLIWFVGSTVAMVVSVMGGLPMWFLFRRFGLERHWQYALGGLLCALPGWYLLAQPFDSARWLHAGGFDSLHYLGSGVFGGFFFWLLLKSIRHDHNNAVNVDTQGQTVRLRLGTAADDELFSRLREKTGALGGTIEDVKWDLGASRQVTTYLIKLPEGQLQALADTEDGLFLQGDGRLVSLLAQFCQHADPDVKAMFIVETTWQGKRQSHSWLTCVSLSRQVAETYSDAQSDPKASHRLFEVEGLGFPVFFVGVPEGYRHLSLAALKSHLAAAEVGMAEEMLFNVYRFSGEYLWSTPGRDQTALHMHVTSESLAHYRLGKGELAQALSRGIG